MVYPIESGKLNFQTLPNGKLAKMYIYEVQDLVLCDSWQKVFIYLLFSVGAET